MFVADAFHAESGLVFLRDPRVTIDPGSRMFERMTEVVRATGAGWVYSDAVGHPRIDYQAGSIRENFDFGAVVALDADAYKRRIGDDWLSLYDLRLRISETLPVVRVPEPLY